MGHQWDIIIRFQCNNLWTNKLKKSNPLSVDNRHRIIDPLSWDSWGNILAVPGIGQVMIDVEVRMTGSGAWTAAVAAVALQVISSHPSVPPKKLPSLLVAASSWASRFAKCLTLQRHLDPTWPFRPMAKNPFMKNSPNKNAENLRKMSKVPAFHLSSYAHENSLCPSLWGNQPHKMIMWWSGRCQVHKSWTSWVPSSHLQPLTATYSHLQPLTATCKLPFPQLVKFFKHLQTKGSFSFTKSSKSLVQTPVPCSSWSSDWWCTAPQAWSWIRPWYSRVWRCQPKWYRNRNPKEWMNCQHIWMRIWTDTATSFLILSWLSSDPQ